MDRSRLEAFSDGVFAVAITLLALDLTVAGPGHGPLLDQLYDKWPAFLAYLISFFMIGIVWVNHHALVRSIIKVDRTLLFLNLVLLLFVVLIPFATATEADYFPRNDRDAQLAMVLYAGVFLGMSAGFGAIFEWTLHGQRVYQPLPPGAALAGPAAVRRRRPVLRARPRGRALQRRRLVRADRAGRRVLHLGEHPGLPRPRPLRRRRAGGLKAAQMNSCH